VKIAAHGHASGKARNASLTSKGNIAASTLDVLIKGLRKIGII